MARSRIFLFSLLSFIGGVALASFVSFHSLIIYVLFGFSFFLLGVWGVSKVAGRISPRNFLAAGLIIIAFAGGVLRYQSQKENAEEARIKFYNGQEISLVGIIIEDPEEREKNIQYVLEVQQTEKDGMVEKSNGKVLLVANPYPAYAYGDVLLLRGKLAEPELFNGFDYPSYLAKDEIYSLIYYPNAELISSGEGSLLKRTLFSIKHSFQSSIRASLPEPQAGFLEGLILGVRSRIPADLLEAFRATGTMHIIALSGFNITIIAESLSRFLRILSLGPRSIFWVASFIISLFVVLAGASASVVRAAIMGILLLLARKEGRRYTGFNAIICAAAVMVFQNPAILRYDVGFQLSFLATLGILHFSPKLERYVWWAPRRFSIRENLVATLASQTLIFPVLIYYFGSISIISPLVNVLILYVVPVSMLLGFLAGIGGLLSVTLGLVVGWGAYILLTYQLTIIQLFASLPFSNINIGTASGLVAIIVWAWLLVSFSKKPLTK